MAEHETDIDPANLPFAEQLYRRFLDDETSVPESWRDRFHAWSDEGDTMQAPDLRCHSVFDARGTSDGDSDAALQERVDHLVRQYLTVGHRAANLDPLGRPRPEPPELDPRTHGITEHDLDRRVSYGIAGDCARRPLRFVLRHLRECYCRNLGVQLVHIRDREAREWIRRRIESVADRGRPEPHERLHLLRRLGHAVVFEEFVRKKFVGAKSYSLEGGESLLVLLETVLERAGEHGVAELILAMAHRGRLDVLANLMRKPARRIFAQIAGKGPWEVGDLEHHMGESTDRVTKSGQSVHVSLCFNPSHLEFVGPIALGRTRAKQDRSGDHERRRGCAVIVHGDAAFAGEGIAYEQLGLSGLAAYRIGGCVHVVLDNQIGFTTAPEEGRSTEYATDVALMLDVPILHVNGDDPEAVARAARIALDFRQRFQRDVVLDLHCYRRLGHNEVDEPRFTQPEMYRIIDGMPTVHERYEERLVAEGVADRGEVDAMADEHRAMLEDELEALERVSREERKAASRAGLELQGVWEGLSGGRVDRRDAVDTTVPRQQLVRLLESMTRLPAGFHAHKKIERFVGDRAEMASGERRLDWSTAEALAIGSLAIEGHTVRLTGQDTARGTFSQRHASLYDQQTGERFEPLRHLAPDQAPVEIENSPLSEAGVLGFEYGYSLDRPTALVMWEAQFGDFTNAAQVVIDQFLASAENKWRRLSALVLLLPHGFEGQGPEHSSARPERFLLAFAEDNLQVVQPSTPAQFFHVLRRQTLQSWKKPLVVLTPKSLLRARECTSTLDEFADGRFHRLIDDPEPPERTERILLCSGKLFYELARERRDREETGVRIVRVEEIAPFPDDDLRALLDDVSGDAPVVWVQEEPRNMGAWHFLAGRFEGRCCDRPLIGVTRPSAASPAGGSSAAHHREQRELLERAFGDPE